MGSRERIGGMLTELGHAAEGMDVSPYELLDLRLRRLEERVEEIAASLRGGTRQPSRDVIRPTTERLFAGAD